MEQQAPQLPRQMRRGRMFLIFVVVLVPSVPTFIVEYEKFMDKFRFLSAFCWVLSKSFLFRSSLSFFVDYIRDKRTLFVKTLLTEKHDWYDCSNLQDVFLYFEYPLNLTGIYLLLKFECLWTTNFKGSWYILVCNNLQILYFSVSKSL